MAEERTEAASPKKLREARRRGDVWRSRTLGTALALLAVGAVGGVIGESLLDAHVATFRLALDAAAGRAAGSPGALLEASLARTAAAVAPLLFALVVTGTLAAWAAGGPLFAPGAIAWRAERLDPVRGARRIVDPRRAIEMLQALVIVALVAYVGWATLRDGLHGVLALVERDALAALRAAGTMARTLLLRAGGAVLAVAVLDVVYQRWRWHRDQRMTRREVEREHREAHGDPHLQRERERVRRELAERSELAHAARATVLVAGGGVAVALHYDHEREDAVPEVLARARGELAVRMERAAGAAGVMIAPDAALARSLHELPAGAEIARHHYEPVAALLRGR